MQALLRDARFYAMKLEIDRTILAEARQLARAFQDETAPRFLVRDRDQIYGERFRRMLKVLGVEEVVTAARSPWQNACATADRLASAGVPGSHRRPRGDPSPPNPGRNLRVLQPGALPPFTGGRCTGTETGAGTRTRQGGGTA